MSSQVSFLTFLKPHLPSARAAEASGRSATEGVNQISKSFSGPSKGAEADCGSCAMEGVGCYREEDWYTPQRAATECMKCVFEPEIKVVTLKG